MKKRPKFIEKVCVNIVNDIIDRCGFEDVLTPEEKVEMVLSTYIKHPNGDMQTDYEKIEAKLEKLQERKQ